MSNTLAKYAVVMEAQTAKYERGLQRAQRQLDRFEKKNKLSLQKVSKIFATLGVSIGVTFWKLSRQSVKAADAVGKAAKQAGIAAEALQELRFAGEQSGISIRGMDDSLRRMNRRLGEFVNSGGGPAAKAIEDLGVSVRDANGKIRSSESVFNDIVTKLRSIDTQAQRAAYAAQFFGDDFGPKLVPLLDQGADGIAKLRKEAWHLGSVMSNETVASAESAEDQFNRLEKIIRGRMIKAFADNAETIEESTKAITNFIISTLNGFNNLRKFFGWETETEELKRQLREVQDEIVKTRNDIDEGIYPNTLLARAKIRMGDISGYAENTISGEKEAKERLAKLITKHEELFKRFSVIENQRNRLAKIKPSTIDSTPYMPRISDDDLADYVRGFEKIEDRVARQLEELEARKSELQKAFPGYYEHIGKKIREQMYIDEIEVKPKKRSSLFKAVDQMQEYAKQAARNMQDAFADFLFDPFDDGVKGMARGFLNAIRRMLANQAALQIFRLLGNMRGPVGKLFGGARADGGPVSPSQAYLIGERGPELFVPNVAGRIIPNGAGGVTIVQNNSFEAGADLATIQSKIVPVLEDNNEKLKAEFVEEMRRGRFR